MPLEPGSSRTVIGHNIAVEIKSGRKPAVAAAIAYRTASESHDGGPPSRSMRFYAPIRLGPKTSLTKEGFLICHDVPIARIGEMIYVDGEIENVAAGRDGLIRVTRGPEALFRPETIASFEGKPLTIDHPDDDVSPENWSELAKGSMMNVRRGLNELADFLLADILVMDKNAIADIQSGKREVSLGYDAHYEQVEPGRGVQSEILGNHIAVVSRGRCGPVCAIRDRSPTMSKPSIAALIQRAFKAKDATELETITRDAEGMDPGASGAEIHVHNYGQTGDKSSKDETPEEKAEREKKEAEKTADAGFAKIMDALDAFGKRLDAMEAGKGGEKNLLDEEGETKEEKEGKTKDGASKTHDAAPMYSDIVSRAELIAPGVKMPRLTTDAAADPKKTSDGLCMIRRRALDVGSKTEAGRDAVTRMLGGRTIDSLTCDAVTSVFIGASELVRSSNNGKARTMDAATTDTKTIDAFARGGMDKINKNFWDKLKA